MTNLTLLLYSTFVYGLTKLCYGTLRAVEVEQLIERAWFAITETCLAMTIFREEIGAWFLVMFTALVTGKIWGWIGDARVEFLEQQPRPNPRLFHLRLTVSLSMSLLYDFWILFCTINSVVQQARPNMMFMFLFEFAVLATCSLRTGARYLLSVMEQNMIKTQTGDRLFQRRQEVRMRREELIRQREQSATAEDQPVTQEPLPNEDDVDETDIEVPGWAAKGEWVLWLDLFSDMIKLAIYVAFFFMLLMFYGLPIHIMRDLLLTVRDFLKRLSALLRYKRAVQEMSRYPDATAEDLAQESTCIICREEMRVWRPQENAGSIDRVRPKKLPCGHILHLGCLKSWLERQQVCPTCRSPVTANRTQASRNRVAGFRIQIGGLPRPQEQDAAGPGDQGQNGPQPQAGQGGPRVFNFGPIRLGFGANNQQIRQLAQQFGMPQAAGNAEAAPTETAAQEQPTLGDNLQNVGRLLQQSEQMVHREEQRLQYAQQELRMAHLLLGELQRLQQRRLQPQDQHQAGRIPQTGPAPTTPPTMPSAPQPDRTAIGTQQPSTPAMLPGMPPPGQPGPPHMTRFGVPNRNAAIPAGSPQLPHGITLPPGWTLMPLHRLEGGVDRRNFSHAPTQNTAPPRDASQRNLFPQLSGAAGIPRSASVSAASATGVEAPGASHGGLSGDPPPAPTVSTAPPRGGRPRNNLFPHSPQTAGVSASVTGGGPPSAEAFAAVLRNRSIPQARSATVESADTRQVETVSETAPTASGSSHNDMPPTSTDESQAEHRVDQCSRTASSTHVGPSQQSETPQQHERSSANTQYPAGSSRASDGEDVVDQTGTENRGRDRTGEEEANEDES